MRVAAFGRVASSLPAKLSRRTAAARAAAACVLLCSASASAAPRAAAMAASSFRKVPAETLFISEPPPDWFGNEPNVTSNPSWTCKNWLQSRFHFSFAEYRSAERSQYGVLRVLNDDLVQPARGFGTHPHSNMEICTYIVEGSLTHADSMGTRETLGRGAVQFMTAGTGVRHSEHNLDAAAPLRFIQMWLQPRRGGLKPNYGSFVGDAAGRAGRWQHLVGDVDDAKHTPHVHINTDANIYAAELAAGASLAFELKQQRQAYVVLLEGAAAVSGPHGSEQLVRHDAAMVAGSGAELTFIAGADGAHVLLVEMAKDR